MKIVYHTVIRDATPRLQSAVREEMVAYATRHGIKPACRNYGVSRTTVRKWVRRAKEDEPLTNRSTRHANSPNALDRVEKRIDNRIKCLERKLDKLLQRI